jgi:hypothetical protein
MARLFSLAGKLWKEVRREQNPNARTLAKAQVALALELQTYIPSSAKNLIDLEFDTSLFVRGTPGAVSTLEISGSEVKNGMALSFDIPPAVAKLLIDYRDRIAPKIIGHRPKRLFVKALVLIPQTLARWFGKAAPGLIRRVGGAGQRAHRADKGRDLAPAGDRFGGAAAVLERVPITLRRARRQAAVQPAAPVRHRRRPARAAAA